MPTNFLEALQRVEGAATARTVGTDCLTPSSARLLPKAFPSAELVDAEPLLRRVRSGQDCPKRSTRSAPRSASPSARCVRLQAALEAGVTERQLTGVFMGAMAEAGVTTPASQDVAWITSPEHPWRRTSRDVPVEQGDLVAFDAGVILGGYVGELGRTRVVGGDATTETSPARPVERAVGSAPRALPGRNAVDGSPRRVRRCRGAAASHAGRARAGTGIRLPLVTHALPVGAQRARRGGDGARTDAPTCGRRGEARCTSTNQCTSPRPVRNCCARFHFARKGAP